MCDVDCTANEQHKPLHADVHQWIMNFVILFFREANRILKKNGILKIAEVESRCKDSKQFLRDLQKCGFKLISKNDEHKVFFLIDMKKTGPCSVSDNFPLTLDPCYYKKRWNVKKNAVCYCFMFAFKQIATTFLLGLTWKRQSLRLMPVNTSS